jgi:hypothetical protein
MALTFGSLPGIKAVVVVSLSTASYFMEVFSLELDNDLTCGNSSGISIAFPGLREIEMINVSFFTTNNGLSSGNDDGEDGETQNRSGLDPSEAESQEDDNDADFEDDGVPILKRQSSYDTWGVGPGEGCPYTNCAWIGVVLS